MEPAKIEWAEQAVGTTRCKLWVESIKIKVECTSEVFLFDKIVKGSKCDKHVRQHEAKHITLYRNSWKKGIKDMQRKLEKSDFPNKKSPPEMDVAKGQAFVLKCQRKLLSDIRVFYLNALKDAEKKSESIHRPSELKKTIKLCSDCIPV